MLLTFCTFFVLLKVQNPEAKVHGFRVHWNNKSTKVQKVQIIFRIIRALNIDIRYLVRSYQVPGTSYRSQVHMHTCITSLFFQIPTGALELNR